MKLLTIVFISVLSICSVSVYSQSKKSNNTQSKKTSAASAITSANVFLTRLAKFTDNLVLKTDDWKSLENNSELKALLTAKEKLSASFNATQQKRYEKIRDKGRDKILESELFSLEDITFLYDYRLQISIADVKGTDEAVDIVEFREMEEIPLTVSHLEKPHVTVEKMPGFPGGEGEMQKFIGENLKYPAVAVENGVQGRVTLRFIVEKDGAISDVRILRGIDPSCDKEAVRVIKAMPKWIPAKQNGREVRCYFTLPIVFRLPSEPVEKTNVESPSTVQSDDKSAKSVEEFLNNLDKFVKNVFLKIDDRNQLNKYKSEMEALERDYRKFRDDFTDEDKARYEKLEKIVDEKMEKLRDAE